MADRECFQSPARVVFTVRSRSAALLEGKKLTLTLKIMVEKIKFAANKLCKNIVLFIIFL